MIDNQGVVKAERGINVLAVTSRGLEMQSYNLRQ